MVDTNEKAATQLREITECPICISAFTDPRVLPCIHTFCFECLKRTRETAQKKPGDKMPCPLCRKEFLIPADGIDGVQKNFFMENLLQYKMTLQTGSATIICDVCSASDESKTGEIPTATMRCLECQDNYCDSCSKVHQFQKLSRNHQLVKIGSDAVTSGMKRGFSMKYCSKHNHKLLDYYCAECKKIVCVSCFVESHKSHDCKDIATVGEEFRQTIEKNAWKISKYVDEMLVVKEMVEKRKADFLKEIVETENAIHKRKQELKEMIDRDTKLLLDELSVVKSNQLKKIENEVEIIDTSSTILKNFEVYCTELTLKGSASDICSSVDELVLRADELEKDHEAFIGRLPQSVEVSFQATDLTEALQKFNNNVVGNIRETTTLFENCAIVVGLCDGSTIPKDIIKINLHRPNEISAQEQNLISTLMADAFAAVYCNTMYVTGIGWKAADIWKYNQAFGWMKCASLVEGRRRHCAAFINEILYICGGFAWFSSSVLDSVEAYNAVTDKCAGVGKLVHCVKNSGNCVPFKGSLYIFAGSGKDNKAFNHVQVYNTKENTCSVLSTPMPRSYNLMRAALWETSVILLGRDTCFIFNFVTETWHERKQFKTDVDFMGLVLENERVFVIGGGIEQRHKTGKTTWKCRDDVRYVPLQNILDDKPIEWTIHGKLPKPCLVHACANLSFLSSK